MYNAGSKTWSTPQQFETDSQGISQHAVGVDANGNALFVWMNGYVRARRYSAGSWSAASTIESADSLTEFSVSVNSSGNAMALIGELIWAVTELDWGPYAVYLHP